MRLSLIKDVMAISSFYDNSVICIKRRFDHFKIIVTIEMSMASLIEKFRIEIKLRNGHNILNLKVPIEIIYDD